MAERTSAHQPRTRPVVDTRHSHSQSQNQNLNLNLNDQYQQHRLQPPAPPIARLPSSSSSLSPSLFTSSTTAYPNSTSSPTRNTATATTTTAPSSTSSSSTTSTRAVAAVTAASTSPSSSSSARVTRSSARAAAAAAASQAQSSPSGSAAGSAALAGTSGLPSNSNSSPAASASNSNSNTNNHNLNQNPSQPASRKRKAAPPSPPPAPALEQPLPVRRSKRQKLPEQQSSPPALPSAPQPQHQVLPHESAPRRKKGKAPATMSSPEAAPGPANPSESNPSASSSRKSSRSKKSLQNATESAAGPSSSTRRSKRNVGSVDQEDVTMGGTEENEKDHIPPPPPPPDVHPTVDDSEENDDDDAHRYDGDDDDDPFGGFGGPGRGLSSTLAALTGIMPGLSSRLRHVLTNLRQKEDPTLQLIALQELSEILLVSNEDNLAGHFVPDAFVKELVPLMQPDDFMEANPEIMLLACRCLANLMEALPASVANVACGGAVPVLCAKLRDIEFIDLAEQALSTLEKISLDYPGLIVKNGGLAACLEYLDFFATSTQRTAVTTAANCCRNIDAANFEVVQDAMRILRDVLKSSDQRVVEQASLCVSRIVDSFTAKRPSKLEALISTDLLQSILRLLLPGTTNLIGPNIHTQFLRVLANTARASPRLSAELFRMNVVETLYQILTGVSPPNGTDDVASKLDSVLIMQALIHRPREQIIETLNVICELLPKLPDTTSAESMISASHSSRRDMDEKRTELLETCKDEVRRFALILFPTLTDAFSSTVNLEVRQKVLLAQLKMLSNLDVEILIDALKPVPYASFLASILSQQDHPSLVFAALQATELLMRRLDHIYRYQVYREGVIAEITKLSTEQQDLEDKATSSDSHEPDLERHSSAGSGDPSSDQDSSDDNEEEDENEDGDGDGDGDGSHHSSEDENDENDHDHDADDSPGSPSSADSTMSLDRPLRSSGLDKDVPRSRIIDFAKKFLETHETEKHGKAMKKKAAKILEDLSSLATDIEAFYLRPTSGIITQDNGTQLFTKLASFFDSDVLESVTSAELLASGVVRVLEEVFNNPDEKLAIAAQSAFLEVFMGYPMKSKPKTATAESPATPFSVMIHKLQDLLSRSEHFEVVTVHPHNSYDGSRSNAASMLAKQIRLKLFADDDSGIPRPYRNIMVSIHAIATFKSLDDYLRPRISLSERPRGSRNREGLSRALAAMAGSAGLPLSAAAAHLADRPPPSMMGGSTPPPPAPPQASGSRSSRKAKSRSQPQPEIPATPEPASSTSREKGVLRRATRRQPALAETPPTRPPPDDDDDLDNALECADEKHLTDDDDLGESSALDAIVGDLDEDMDDAPVPDPGAVNLEVAAGGKITARKEDGTRVPTPSQGNSSLPSRTSALTAALQGSPSPATSSRPMSYAAAIQAIPQDWHIEFSYNGKVLANDTTVYRAVQSQSLGDHPSRNVWSAQHEIKVRRVPGPPPAEPISSIASIAAGSDSGDSSIPASLTNHPTTASILRLLKMLHDLNANIDDVLVENIAALKLNVEPLSQFVNTKLTAKLNRQLEEPLIVASNCLPSWSEDLARLYPFLFPFETRHLFLQSTSFGYARSMTRWQNAQPQEESRRARDNQPFLGRLQRQKVRISRSKILESALKVMELYGASQSILEVEYFEEVGTGLGPTLEFYSTVSKEFSKKKLKLWRDTDHHETDEFVSGPSGLFPRPLSEDDAQSPNGERIMQLFKMLGKFVARSMIDSRIIDINFNPIFFRIGDESSGIRPSLGAMKIVDPVLARSLLLVKKFALAKKEIAEDPDRNAAQKVTDTENIIIDNGIRIEDLALDFTLPGYPEIELIPNGSQIMLTLDNVDLYLEKVIDTTLGTGVRRQVDAFRIGFSQVFPYSALSAFTPDELVTLFGRVDEDWSLETLMDSVKADHGYNMDSKSVRNLLQTMCELSPAQRRDFLQFTTGSPKLPIGGFRSLTPMFTVVCKPSEPPYTSDDYLPSVMTCVNYLKLPDYTDINVMKKRLFVAIREGQGAFHLS